MRTSERMFVQETMFVKKKSIRTVLLSNSLIDIYGPANKNKA